MSKGVGEYFIYLCIPECTYRQHTWMEALGCYGDGLYMVHLRLAPRPHTQLVYMDHES